MQAFSTRLFAYYMKIFMVWGVCCIRDLLLTLLLLVANLASIRVCKKTEKIKWQTHWHMGTHPRVLSKSYPIKPNMTGFRWFVKNICFPELWTKVASALKRFNMCIICICHSYSLLAVSFEHAVLFFK